MGNDEGLFRPEYCPRGLKDCDPLSQIISNGSQSFLCCGENDGTTREVKQDKYRVCFKNETIDEMSDWDKRDITHQLSVLAGALAIIEELEDE